MTPQSNAYIAKMRQIPGWLTLNDATALCAIDEIQKRHLVGGGLLELGVYRGMSLGLLMTLAHPSEEVVGIDLFEDEDPQVVHARLVQMVDGAHNAPSLFKCSSRDFRSLDKVSRLIHIDAGHEFADVYADIKLLWPTLAPLGAMAIDDYFDKDSPGVAMATMQACMDFRLAPFLCGENKMFLCHEPSLPLYLQAVLETEPFTSRARIQTLPSGPIIVGFPNKPHETARIVQQVLDWAAQ